MLKQRVLTALLLFPFAVAIVLYLPTIWFALVCAAAFLIAAWEWSRLSGLRATAAQGVFLLATALLLVGLWTQRETTLAWSTVAIGLMWWIAAGIWLRHFTFGAAPTAENTRLKLLAGVLTLVPAWIAVILLHGTADRGPYWMMLALLIVWAADVGAYSCGRLFGTTKLAPRISPGKTRAGFWGGLGGGALIAASGGWLFGLDWFDVALLTLLAVLCVAVSVVGDLFESLIKRHANLKDSGQLFPGHGGMFDRLDSVFAAMPVFVAGKSVLGL